MTLDEAIAIRQLGFKAPAHLTDEAKRVIQLANAMVRSQGARVDFVGLSRRELDRINSILAYRLALVCGKLEEWRA